MLTVKVAIQTPLRKSFDYLVPEGVSVWPGVRVWVPFGGRRVVGVVLGQPDASDVPVEKLKTIEAVIDEKPLLDDRLLQLYYWAADYYHHPIGQVIVGTLPKRVREGGVNVGGSVSGGVGEDACLMLTQEQSTAIDAVLAADAFSPFLLAGVTGSGKTEVYLRVIEKILAEQKQALVLVPEISLTPQTVARFQARLSAPVLLLHSGLTDKQRSDAWMQATQDQPCVVIGTRSAVFAPLKNLGVIVIDEEHDLSFKQQSGFRYSARDVAMMRAKFCDIPIILGSATPALETLKNAHENKYQLLSLTKRVGQATLPTVTIFDVRRKKMQNGLSADLIALMKQHLSEGNQVLLFLNRRGYAPLLLCHHCGHIEKCTHCDARLTAHEKLRYLLCHHCGFKKSFPKICPACQQNELMTLGLGTEQLTETLEKYFPQKKILRVDRDTVTTFKKLEKALAQIRDHEIDIVVGTQMLVKGHHFENVTLVAAIDIDQALFSNDFRAIERMGQSLIQVAGRAGRVEKKGEVFIQTHHADHPLLKKLLHENYDVFSKDILDERAKALLPPYRHMAILRAEGKSRETVHRFLQGVQSNIAKNAHAEIAGPFPLNIERLAGNYRAQLFLQSEHRAALQQLIKQSVAYLDQQKKVRTVKWTVDVDPLEV